MTAACSRVWCSVVVVMLSAACVAGPVAIEYPETRELGTQEHPETPGDSNDGKEEVELQPLPGATDVGVRAVNRFGHVVGESGGRAVLWEDGAPTALPRLPGSFEEFATSINDAGQIVGVAHMGEETHLAPYRAVLWEGGEAIDLGTLPGHTGAMANHIDNAGRIVGHSDASEDPEPNAPRHRETTAVLWVDREIRALPTPEGFPARPNADFSSASGLILGTSFEPELELIGRFIVWSLDGEILWVGGAPGDGAGVLNHWVGITEAGDAYVTDFEHRELEIHWRDGETTDWVREPPKKYVASLSPGGLLVGGIYVEYPDELEWGFWKDDEFHPFEDQDSGCSLIGDGGHVVCRTPDGVFVRELDLRSSGGGCGCPAGAARERDDD